MQLIFQLIFFRRIPVAEPRLRPQVEHAIGAAVLAADQVVELVVGPLVVAQSVGVRDLPLHSLGDMAPIFAPLRRTRGLARDLGSHHAGRFRDVGFDTNPRVRRRQRQP
jgi:hypothetical protein